MLSAPIITVGGMHDVGLRVGMFFTFVAAGALSGPPISGAINHSTGKYQATGYYAGVLPVCYSGYLRNDSEPVPQAVRLLLLFYYWF